MSLVQITCYVREAESPDKAKCVEWDKDYKEASRSQIMTPHRLGICKLFL